MVVVQPKGAEWYRSQVTEDDLKYATTGTTADGHPTLDYQAVYPAGHKFAGLPVLNMLQKGTIVHSDLTALITGPNAGRFPPGTYRVNAVQPDRDQPFREFALIYHDEIGAVQAFPEFEDPQLKYTLHGVRDAFAINYGTGGAGAEILANRFGVGPSADCTECSTKNSFSALVLATGMVSTCPRTRRARRNAQERRAMHQAGRRPPGLLSRRSSNVYHAISATRQVASCTRVRRNITSITSRHRGCTIRTATSLVTHSQAIGPGASFTLEMAQTAAATATNRRRLHSTATYPPRHGMCRWARPDVFEGERSSTRRPPGRRTRALPTPRSCWQPPAVVTMPPWPGAAAASDGDHLTTGPDHAPATPGILLVPAGGHRPSIRR